MTEYYCECCSYSTKIKSQLERHFHTKKHKKIYEIHKSKQDIEIKTKQIERCTCELCGKALGTIYSKKRHIEKSCMKNKQSLRYKKEKQNIRDFKRSQLELIAKKNGLNLNELLSVDMKKYEPDYKEEKEKSEETEETIHQELGNKQENFPHKESFLSFDDIDDTEDIDEEIMVHIMNERLERQRAEIRRQQERHNNTLVQSASKQNNTYNKDEFICNTPKNLQNKKSDFIDQFQGFDKLFGTSENGQFTNNTLGKIEDNTITNTVNNTKVTINGEDVGENPMSIPSIKNALINAFGHPFFSDNLHFVPIDFFKDDDFRLYFNYKHNMNIEPEDLPQLQYTMNLIQRQKNAEMMKYNNSNNSINNSNHNYVLDGSSEKYYIKEDVLNTVINNSEDE